MMGLFVHKKLFTQKGPLSDEPTPKEYLFLHSHPLRAGTTPNGTTIHGLGNWTIAGARLPRVCDGRALNLKIMMNRYRW